MVCSGMDCSSRLHNAAGEKRVETGICILRHEDQGFHIQLQQEAISYTMHGDKVSGHRGVGL